MISAFFPPILPEEPVGFYISRIEGCCGIGNPRPVRAEQLGAPGRTLDTRLPRNLSQLMQALSIAFPSMTLWDWVSLHSDFPYYAASLHSLARESLLTRMCSYKSGPLLPLHALPGEDSLLARPLLCSECRAADEKTFGCGYVHRYGTLPCIEFCPLHGIRLLRAGSQGAIACPTTGRALDNTLEFCLASCRLLESVAVESHLVEVRSRLELAGLLTKSGRVRVQWLVEAINSAYCDGFLQPTLAALTLDADAIESWLRLALRQSCHPVYYLLLMGGIRGTRTFPAQTSSMRTNDYRCARAIENVKCGVSVRSASAIAGVATATLLRRVRSAGIHYRTRAKRLFAPEQRQVLQSLAAGASIAIVCRRHRISASSAYRILASSAQTQRARRSESLGRMRERFRSAWCSLLEEHRDAMRTTLRHLEPAVWTWLRRHDDTWLQKNQPLSTRGGGPSTKILPSSEEVTKALARLKEADARLSGPKPRTARRVLDAAGIPSAAHARLSRCEGYRVELTRIVEKTNS